MANHLLTKNQWLIVAIVFFIAPLMPGSFETNPHLKIDDFVYIFIFSLLMSILLLKFYEPKKSRNLFFSSYENLLFFIGGIFTASGLLPLFINCFEKKAYCIDSLFMVVGGVGIITGTIIRIYLIK